VRLSDFSGRWVYLDVFGSWCPPCRSKYPEMIEIAREMGAAGAAVVGLLLEDRPASAAQWLDANGGLAYPFLVLDDETSRAWGMTGAPMGFLISPDGRVERLCYGCARGPGSVDELPDEVR
jgi:thiol-disulfide isomerase/thioredoxin